MTEASPSTRSALVPVLAAGAGRAVRRRCRPRRWSSSGSACGLSFVGILLRLFPWALLPALLAAVIAFKRVGGWPLHELIPLKVAWLARPAPDVAGSGRSRC